MVVQRKELMATKKLIMFKNHLKALNENIRLNWKILFLEVNDSTKSRRLGTIKTKKIMNATRKS